MNDKKTDLMYQTKAFVLEVIHLYARLSKSWAAVLSNPLPGSVSSQVNDGIYKPIE
jgi:hypothetical protein